MWQPAIDSFTIWLRAAGAAAQTVRIRRHYLRLLARAHPGDPWTLTVDDLAAFTARPGWQPETRKSARSSVRGFYRWAVLTGRVPTSPAELLPAVRVPRGVPRPAPDLVLHRALAAAGDRDRLMVMLAAFAGLRRGEIAVVSGRDVVDGSLRVHGKGGRVRVVPLHPALRAALAGAPCGWLFPGGAGRHLSADRVGRILARLLGGGWTGHTLRHRFCTRAYAGERDLRAVQELAGHARLDTTAVYTQVPDGALWRAVLAAGPAA